MLYLVNSPSKAKGRRKGKRRTAKQKAATRKMLAARKRAAASKRTKARTNTGSTNMARKARKSGGSRKRRRSSKRRGAGVRLVRRGQTVYQGNPKRRGRRRGGRRYHRNPGILGIAKQSVMDAGATLVGGAAARAITGFVPLPDAGLMGVAKGAAVAIGVGLAARRFTNSDTARFITAGAMQVPLKALITTFMPSAGAFLGEYDGVSAYIEEQGGGNVSGYVDQVGGMGALYDTPAELGTYL